MSPRTRIFATFALLTVTAPAAAQFTAGNIVIYQAGNGSGALATTGNVVLLKEFTTGGTASGFTVTMPSTGSGTKLVASGTATSEGLITLGNNGQTLALTGYNSTLPAGGDLTASTSASVNRTIALVTAAATSNASAGVTYTVLSDFSSGGSPRGAFTTNGTDIWVTGGAGGVRYTTAGSTTSTQLSTTVTNLRGVAVYGGQLYISTSSGSSVRVGSVGSGTPTTSGQTINNVTATPTSPYQFAFLRFDDPANPLTFPGPNVLYVANDATSQIQKYTFDGSTWNAAGTLTASAVRGLTPLITADNQVVLYATTGASAAAGGGTLWSLTDGSGTGTLSGTVTSISTAGANTAYRGVAFAPANLVYSGSGNWDTLPGNTNWTNTAASGSPSSAYFNVYAANFGNIATNKTVSVDSGLYPQAVNVTNAANTYTFTNMGSSNGIQGLGTLTRSGAGTLVLASPNLYAGGTTINGGTLVVTNATGSGTGVGSVTVNSGGILAGTGTISPLSPNVVTVSAGGAIRGGNPVGATTADHVGTLTVNSNVSINSTASTNGILQFEANRLAANGATASLLQLGNTNTLNLNPGSGNKFTIELVVTPGTTAVQANETYLLNLAAVGPGGHIQLNSTNLTNGTTIDHDNYVLQSAAFSFAAGPTLTVTGSDANGYQLSLQFTPLPVPEPAAVLGIAGGALALGRLLRRRLEATAIAA